MYTLKNFERIAKEFLTGRTDTLDGIERRLITWFCLTFNTTPQDDKLMNMTLEELIVLYYMHLLKNNPAMLSEEEKDDYEEWLKKQMGEHYASEEQMVEQVTKFVEQEQKVYETIKDKLPDKITTDFTNPQEE